jgi:hypothetical protein
MVLKLLIQSTKKHIQLFSGALMWWGPNFAFYGAKAICGNKAGCENITQNDIS